MVLQIKLFSLALILISSHISLTKQTENSLTIFRAMSLSGKWKIWEVLSMNKDAVYKILCLKNKKICCTGQKRSLLKACI